MAHTALRQPHPEGQRRPRPLAHLVPGTPTNPNGCVIANSLKDIDRYAEQSRIVTMVNDKHYFAHPLLIAAFTLLFDTGRMPHLVGVRRSYLIEYDDSVPFTQRCRNWYTAHRDERRERRQARLLDLRNRVREEREAA